MSWERLPIRCPKCGTAREQKSVNGYWCKECRRMEYAPLKPLSYDDGGER